MFYVAAPENWYWELFPRGSEVEEVVALSWVAELSMALIEESFETGDSSPMGPAMHWAHRFVITQDADGSWPKVVNLRTGEIVDEERIRRPADFLEKLGDALNSSEFDRAVARARVQTSSAEVE